MIIPYDVENFYPRPPRGGRHTTPSYIMGWDEISIHALREEGDTRLPERRVRLGDFYPRPPRGGRPDPADQAEQGLDFYPRPPRGGRPRTEYLPNAVHDFYPRPPRGGRPALGRHCPQAKPISIHALREEGDCCCICIAKSCCIFLSTPSARRATRLSGQRHICPEQISSHALREEGDHRPCSPPLPCTRISIHALREEGDDGHRL